MPRTPLILAPADEQSVVGPFLLSSRPRWGSLAVADAPFGPPLSGSPRPPSQPEVTMLEPAAGPQSPGLPTNIQGSARRLSALALDPVEPVVWAKPSRATADTAAAARKAIRFMLPPQSVILRLV